MATTQGTKSRLSREEWLARALQIISREGQCKLRIHHLVRDLGVTTGSFYWHFKNRDEFVLALLEYWDRTHTTEVIDRVKNSPGSPEEKLHFLMEMLLDEEHGRYDVAMRAWAAQEPAVAHVVRRVDDERLEFIRGLFGDMGFRDDDCEMRSRLWLYYEMSQSAMLGASALAERRRLLELRFRLLTAR